MTTRHRRPAITGAAALRALRLCRSHWDWLSRHPAALKHQWPDMPAGLVNYNCCAACWFSDTRGRSFCGRNCILPWGSSKGCLGARTPYVRWRSSNDLGVRRSAALDIVAICDKAIAALHAASKSDEKQK